MYCITNSCQNQNFTKMKICYDCRDKSTIHLIHRGFFIINFTSIKCCIFKKPNIESRVASNLYTLNICVVKKIQQNH